jgi:hypothetical protein
MVSPGGAMPHHPSGVIPRHPAGSDNRPVRTRRIAAATLLVLGTILWIAFGFGIWAKRQALDTDNWVDTSGQLLENENIRTTLAYFVVDELYNSQAAEQRLEQVLPPELSRLAGPASAGLKEIARRNAPRLLGTSAALTAWEAANRKAHETVLAIVEGDVGEKAVTLDLGDLFEEVAAGTGLPTSAVDKIPPNISNMQLASADEIGQVRDWLDLFQTIVWVLLGLALACFAGAIALSRDRRRMILNVGGCMMFAGVALVAIRSVSGKQLENALADAPNAHAIAGDVWSIGTSLLVDVAQGTFLFGLFVVLGAWLAGQGRRATATRRFSAHPLHNHAGAVWAGLGVLILLLVIWGPVPWTQRPITVLIFIVLAAAWLGWIRRRTLEEFPDEPPPRLRWPRRAAEPAA